jgi:hypothetical protein
MASDPSWSSTGRSPTMEALHRLLFQPTEEQRRTVRAMAGFGVTHKDIEVMLDIDLTMLQQHFRHELDRGSVETTAKVAQTLFHMATVDKNVSAAIFWLKARAGWSEKVGIAGGDGSPLVIRVMDFSSVDDTAESESTPGGARYFAHRVIHQS